MLGSSCHVRFRARFGLPAASAIAAILRLVLGLMLFAAPERAVAQTPGWGFLGGIFGQPQQAPPQPLYRRPYKPQRRAVAAPRPREETREVESPPVPKPPPVNASHFVLVLGDSLGQLLANGLDEAFSDRPDVAVLHKARDSSGLVREDFYDWPKAVASLLSGADTPGKVAAGTPDKAAAAKDKIDVAVMMIGSNDRQAITEAGKTYAAGSEEWTAIYTRRVTTIAEAFKARNVPLVWVGVPITKSDSFADDMAALNEIYRDVAARTGATYVDTWEAFSDDNGDFSAFGPDINGQTVRLRSADGIHFTKAGARKLAHFVETHIRRALDQMKSNVPAFVALPPADEKMGDPGKGPIPSKNGTVDVPVPVKPDAGPVKILTELPLSENGRLRTPTGPRDDGRDDALIETTLVKGEPQPAHPGRADDAAWPPH